MAQFCRGFYQKFPLVSIIIPSRNRFDYLIASLGSVFSQTYENFEVIVVDDGSTVPLAHLLKGKLNDKLACLRNETPLGAPAARNAGLAIARGDFIAFLDDDDLWLPEKLTAQIEAFRDLSEKFGVVYCGYDFLVHDKIIKNKNRYHEDTDLALKSLEGCPFGSPTPLIRRTYLEIVSGYDTSLPSCQDWDLWIRLAKICKFYPVREALALYRIHGDQISTDLGKKIEARKILLAKHYRDLSGCPRILSSFYARLGSLCVLMGRDEEARHYFRKSLTNNKFNASCIAHLILQFVCKPLEKRLIELLSVSRINGFKLLH
jgi:glycosyltransferase involved in cell wall biosynthesis